MAVLPMSQPSRPSAADVLRAVRAGFVAVLHREPSRREREWTLAQIWLETAQGSALWQHNVGNITAGPSWQGDIWRPNWFEEPGPDASERTRELHRLMLEGRAPSAFRAYPSLEAGAADYVRQLDRSFPELLRAMGSGSALTVARAVRDSAYDPSTQPESAARGFEAMRTQLRAQGVFGGAAPSGRGGGGGGGVLGVAALAALAAMSSGRRW